MFFMVLLSFLRKRPHYTEKNQGFCQGVFRNYNEHLGRKKQKISPSTEKSARRALKMLKKFNNDILISKISALTANNSMI